jgi:hypothetical protein
MRDFVWLGPAVADIRWVSGTLLRRIGRWAEKVGRGKVVKRQPLAPAEFHAGGTIGPARKDSVPECRE